MKAFFVLFGFFCLHWSFVVDGAPSIKRLELGDKVSGSIISITTLAPTVTSTPLAAVVNNATVNSTAFNSNITSYSDQKHKILLVVLSDVNVRHVKDPQQGKLLLLLYIIIKKSIKTFKNAFTIGQSPTISNNADNNSLNETLKIDATLLKEILKNLQPTKKCVNILPQFVQPTFPWLIRKEQRKSITYIEPVLCEDIEDERVVLMESSILPQNQKRQPIAPVKTKVGYSQTRSSKNTRKRQRSKLRTGSAKKSRQLPYSLNNFRDLDYEHDSEFDNDWTNFSSEEN
ncbi:uncharacterized protein [Bactrocera oleae]|uniref:uncharacterized protein isoform X1 n=1 Tax=Bactrocera oleae TaxID=104688 RepID=UPI00387EA568